MLRSDSIMSPLQSKGSNIVSRRDASLGWAFLYAKQSSALAASLAKPGGTTLFAPPSPAPFGAVPAIASKPAPSRRVLRACFVSLASVLSIYVALTSILVLCYRFVDPPVTVLMAYRKWGYGWKIESPKPRPLKSTPSYIRRMLVSVEDGKFYEHFGVDFEAFRNAREINARIGRPLYGGSTLTMQVARTLFLVPVKSYVRKGLEVIVALELELFLSKDRILELYLGYAEWGKGIFGIESAAKKWYGVGSRSLTRDQAARLIALLSSPVKYRPETLERNGILKERYRYLVRRYVAPASSVVQEAQAAAAPAAAAQGNEPGAAAPKAAPGPEASEQGAGQEVAPPPSPEPGEEVGSSEEQRL